MLVAQSVYRKSVKFYCIIWRTDKTTLLLIRATLRFDITKNYFLSHTNGVQDKGKCEHFFELLQLLKASSTSLHVLSQHLSKTWDSFILRKIFTCFHVFYPVRLLIQKLQLALDEAVKKAACIAPQIWCLLQGGQMWIVKWPLFLLNHLQTVRVQALLSDTCCVFRAPCISLNLPLRPAAVGCSLQ